MKWKNGFTLMELLATLAIIAILTIIVTSSVSSIRTSSLQKAYDSKVQTIISAAIDWAYDNKNDINECDVNEDCKTIEVGDLIDNGYLVADGNNKTQLLDPRSGNSMNDKTVCVCYVKKLVTNDSFKEMVTEYKAELIEK